MPGALDQFDNLRPCRFCGDLFAPIYGVVKAYPSEGVSGMARAVADDLAGEGPRTYFECFKCQDRRRRKRIVFYSALVALVVVAWLLSRYVES